MTETLVWNDRQRALLNAILDQIIPANAARGVPSAGSLDLADRLGETADASLLHIGLARAEALADAMGGSFDRLDDAGRVAVVRELERTEPAFFGALLRHTYMAYYSRPDIRALFGPSADPVHPDGYDVSPEAPDHMAELTEPVRWRGPLYRAC